MTYAENLHPTSNDIAATSITKSASLGAVALAFVYLVAAVVGLELTREAGNVATIWPPHAVLLAVLLRIEVRLWPIYFVACSVANVAANMIYGDPLLIAVGFTFVNMTEVLTGCLLVRRFCGHPIVLSTMRQIIAVAMLAGVCAPVIGAFGGAGLANLAFGVPYWSVWQLWWVADAMGILLIAPIILSWNQSYFGKLQNPSTAIENVAYLIVVILVTSILFLQELIPWLFLVPPVLLLAAIRSGLFVTALAGFLVSVIAISLTVYDGGPIAAVGFDSISERIIFLQLFVGSAVIASLLVSVAMGERQRATDTLIRTSNDLSQANSALETANVQKDNLLRELQHRVKNNLQVVVSLLNLRSDSIIDEAAKQAILEASNRVEALALAHRFFYRSETPTFVPLAYYIPELCEMLARVYAVQPDKISIQTEIDEILIPNEKAIALALLLNELLSNSVKHAFLDRRTGLIRVQLKHDTDPTQTMVEIRICDDGIGLPVQIDPNQPATSGFRIVRALLNQIDGKMELHREEGTEYRIRFPLTKEELV